MAPPRTLVVPAGAPERLDRFLAEALGVSRARVVRAIEKGFVRVDGRRARKGGALSPGATVQFEEIAWPSAPVPEPDQPLAVLHEDPDVLVLDKPAGVPTHPLDSGERGTLANALVARFPECASASDDPREGGLVHRLDTGTSGVIAAARNPNAFAALRAAFSRGAVDKRYVALAGGAPGEGGEIALALAADPSDRRRMIACGSSAEAGRRGAREARTLFGVCERLGAFALLDVEIPTGVRHQIRAHLAAVGAPVVGDEQYGGPPLAGLDRPFLHASRLAFAHPATFVRIEVSSPLPGDLEAVLGSLRGGSADLSPRPPSISDR